MSNPSKIGVGLLGMGVIGSAFAFNLTRRADQIESEAGIPIVLEGILVRDLDKHRGDKIDGCVITADPDVILENPDVNVVVEAIGGQEPAYRFILKAFSQGKQVVTANKEVMARYGPEILDAAEKNGVSVRFEASVAGGTPIIGPLLHDLAANTVVSIDGIINGTTNYILTEMDSGALDFSEALKKTRSLGYAEPNPANDIDGVDSACKLAILSTIAFKTRVRDSDVFQEGITNLEPRDFRYARDLGYKIKLLAIANKYDSDLLVRVHPVLISAEASLAKVDGVLNAIEVNTDLAGRVLFQGSGAGPVPTTSALLGDVIDIARNFGGDNFFSLRPRFEVELGFRSMVELETRYYLRMNVIDREGVLAQIAKILGDSKISIDSVIQKGSDQTSKTAELVITTHKAIEASMRSAIKLLESLEVVAKIGNVIRVHDWE